jgi:hypothetical protein
VILLISSSRSYSLRQAGSMIPSLLLLRILDLQPER